MARLDHVHGRKWINGIMAAGSVLVAYILATFLKQMGEWFDLEAKVRYYGGFSQAAAILGGLLFFVYLFRNQNVQQYLDEVFTELTKVVWANRDDTFKLTIGIIIGVFLTSVVLGVVDFVVNKLLGLLYQ